MNEAKILLHFGTVDADKEVRLSNVSKACKIIADILPNLDENYQIRDNMRELLPKLIRSLEVLPSPITRLLKCFIEIYCRDDLCAPFFTNFATEFHEKETDKDKDDILVFIFEIINKCPKESLDRPDLRDLIRDFMLSKYFSQKKERRAVVQRLMQAVYDRTGRFIELEQPLDFIRVKGGKVLIKGDESDYSEEEIVASEAFEGEGKESENINQQIEQFNKSLKEEKMLERLERYMNEAGIVLEEDSKLLECLKKKEYLQLLAGMVGRPHQYQSATTWMTKSELNLSDPLLMENYSAYTLPSKNDMFAYEAARLNQIEYLNMYAELKNIYRSFIATKILTTPSNIEAILLQYPDAYEFFDLVIGGTKDALKKLNYANVEHFLSVMYCLIAYNNKIALECCKVHNIMKWCGDVLDNRSVHKFILRVLFPADCDEPAEMQLAKETIKGGFFRTLTTVVCLTRRAPDLETAETLHRAGFDNPLVTQTGSFASVGANDTTCTEIYALAALELLFSVVSSFMDAASSREYGYSEYRHTCLKHETFLDYFFGEEGLFFDSVFSTYIEKQKDDNFVNLSVRAGAVVNCVLSLGRRPLKKYADPMKIVIQRYFPALQRMVVDYFDFVMKPKAAASLKEKEEAKGTTMLSRPQTERHDLFRRMMLETLVVICTRYNALYMFSIERATWECLLTYFLKFRKKGDFQMQFYRLINTGFRLGVESIVLDIILYQNMIGEMWDAVQERGRDIIIYKDAPHNELFYNIIARFIVFLESIEGQYAYPIMNKQFTVNLAWKRLKEHRNQGKPPAIIKPDESDQKLGKAMSRPLTKLAKMTSSVGQSGNNNALPVPGSIAPSRMVYRSTTLLPGLIPVKNGARKQSTDQGSGTGRKK